jgi:hypothetical protein
VHQGRHARFEGEDHVSEAGLRFDDETEIQKRTVDDLPLDGNVKKLRGQQRRTQMRAPCAAGAAGSAGAPGPCAARAISRRRRDDISQMPPRPSGRPACAEGRGSAFCARGIRGPCVRPRRPSA